MASYEGMDAAGGATAGPRGRRRLSRRQVLKAACGWAGLGLAGAWTGCRQKAATPVTIAERDCQGDTDVTLLAAADTHCGWPGIESVNAAQIEAMHAMCGRPWPHSASSSIHAPRAVMLLGDLTESGTFEQRRRFEEVYGGSLHFPVLLGVGNHDRWVPHHYLWRRPMHDLVRRLHGGLWHSRDWGDLHFACVGEYPDRAACHWLMRDLAAVGRRRPVIIGMHYCLAGPDADWWEPWEKRRFAKVIEPFNVIAIIHGHHHHSGYYTWAGRPVLRLGSTKDGSSSFTVLRVTDDCFRAASWDWRRRKWQWHLERPIESISL